MAVSMNPASLKALPEGRPGLSEDRRHGHRPELNVTVEEAENQKKAFIPDAGAKKIAARHPGHGPGRCGEFMIRRTTVSEGGPKARPMR